MAIEFGSRRETFENYKVYETMLAGRPFKVEMGKMCGLSNASALIRYGETCVMCNVVMSPKPREGVDFFPLNVEYEEKLYAAGRIPGSFMRREGRPGERAILTSRVVDRPMRPLFPKEMRNDVCITMTVMSLDPDCSPEIAGMIGASLVTAVSDIPWNGPIGGVQVGLVDGEIVLNPTQEQRKVSDLALTVAATMDKIVMIEAGANEVDEDTMLTAIKTAHVEIKKIIEFINKIVAERGKPKIDFQVVGLDMDVFHAIQNKYLDDFKAAMDTDDKNVRDAALLPIMDKIAEEYPDLTAADLDLVSYKMQKFVVRRWLLDEGKRVDGRGINEIRPLAAEVGILPRVHGSGMFTRGQTQVLTTCTLGGTKDNQLMDDLTDEQTKRYIHHYNFPPYSVGEARAPRSPGRREIGHGALAERALVPVLPSLEEFPYTIRCVSEVLSSNGSTSQGSICGSTLALMDAGVPIKAPVAGISCGLIQDGDDFTTFIDIQGVEDFHGEMDFKVAGTKKGITAIQMDLKNDGLTMAIIKNALEITYDARVQILDQIMLPCISEPRAEVSQYAPKMITMHIDPERIREVIGKGGSVIQKIVADTGAKVDIDDDGTIHIASANAAACDAAKKCIDDIVFVPEVGKLYYGRVVRLMQFGAFVEIMPGKEALLRAARACLHAALPPRAAGSVLEICRLANKIFSGYIGGQLVDALLVGGETFALMSIFGLEYAPLLAVLVGVTNIVPVLGPFLGAVPGLIILLLELPWKAAEFAIIIFVVQQVDGNFIAPRILGGATGLPGLGVLLAIVVGGAWFGIPGMVLGVPTLAVLAALLKQAVGAGLTARGLDENGEPRRNLPGGLQEN